MKTKTQITKKICCDLLNMNLNKKFDLIIMRSALDYFPTVKIQIDILKILKKHLKKDGIFINQPAYIPDKRERNIISNIYKKQKELETDYFNPMI